MEHLKTLQAIAHIAEISAKDEVLASHVRSFAEALRESAVEKGIQVSVLFPETDPIGEILQNQYKQDLAT